MNQISPYQVVSNRFSQEHFIGLIIGLGIVCLFGSFSIRETNTITLVEFDCSCQCTANQGSPYKDRLRITRRDSKSNGMIIQYDFIGYSAKFFDSFTLKKINNQVLYMAQDTIEFRKMFSLDTVFVKSDTLEGIPNFGAKLMGKKYHTKLRHWELTFDLWLNFAHFSNIPSMTFDEDLDIPKFTYYNGSYSYDCQAISP